MAESEIKIGDGSQELADQPDACPVCGGSGVQPLEAQNKRLEERDEEWKDANFKLAKEKKAALAERDRLREQVEELEGEREETMGCVDRAITALERGEDHEKIIPILWPPDSEDKGKEGRCPQCRSDDRAIRKNYYVPLPGGVDEAGPLRCDHSWHTQPKERRG